MKLEALMEKFAANAGIEKASATGGVWKFSADRQLGFISDRRLYGSLIVV